MPLPETIKTLLVSAKKIVANQTVKEILFSRGTYEIKIHDPKLKDEFWTFFQLDNKGMIKDSFCTCGEAENNNACVHLVAAWLKVTHEGKQQPLHIRFERSFWNIICRQFYKHFEGDLSRIKNQKNVHEYLDVNGNIIFQAKGKNKVGNAKLHEIFQEREEETEETSIKFSNVATEEIDLWKAGKVSELGYELSFWSDIAKWLMLIQDENAPYEMTFIYDKNQFPMALQVSITDALLEFQLFKEDLPKIIPALNTVNSPLTAQDEQISRIKSITYIPNEGLLRIEHLYKAENSNEIEGKEIDGWIYIPKKGFFSKEGHHLLSKNILKDREIAEVLNEDRQIVKKYLQESIQEKLSPINYTLNFDAKWNLHIRSYLFKPGDLTSGTSRSFGDWVYLEGQGFFHVLRKGFYELETIVTYEQMPDFIQNNVAWLNSQEGFTIHVARLEPVLTFSMNKNYQLSFGVSVPEAEQAGIRSKEFENWIYISGKGFYSKITSYPHFPFPPGLVIPAEHIPFFIRSHREELKSLTGFYSKKSPVTSKPRLIVKLTEAGNIHISHGYDLLPEYQKKEVKFLDEFIYVRNEGFFELPIDIRLPERFRHNVDITPEEIPNFIANDFTLIKSYVKQLDPRLEEPTSIKLIADELIREDKNYLIKMSYETDKGKITLSNIYGAIKRHEKYLFSPAGLINLNQERFHWIKSLKKDQFDRRKNQLSLTALELLRLDALVGFEVREGAEILDFLKHPPIPEEPDLQGLKSNLWPYQEIGVKWLWSLYRQQLSGILSDEMGLGKTHQAMAIFAAIKNNLNKNENKKKVHFLVVCPTSVIYHWQDKLQEYLPNLRVCTFHGSQRSIVDFQKDYDVLLTSYGIWRQEHKLLSQVPFEVAVLDEVQVAKNQTSRIHQSLLTIKANCIIGMTGTPIENRIRELKAIFDIVLPGYMPPESDYRQFFIKPIEQEYNLDRQNLLARFIRPFVLRRRKIDVMPELPEKIEEVTHCDLSHYQIQLYNDVLRQHREAILRELKDPTGSIPYMHIFAVLTSLKQICNHPAVFLKNPQDFKKLPSGKWDLFVELFNEARESQQKVVIYSQYLMMLDIFEEYLKEQGIEYASIRGSTLDRGTQIKRFNQDPNCQVFLGSLQAAGLGIDLTAASVVIHYDRWWNAAREDQATDRVHRIGQKRGVEVFKLVTKKTFEERIDELITKKAKLMEEVVGVDDHRFMKKFDRDELMDLLQFVKD